MLNSTRGEIFDKCANNHIPVLSLETQQVLNNNSLAVWCYRRWEGTPQKSVCVQGWGVWSNKFLKSSTVIFLHGLSCCHKFLNLIVYFFYAIPIKQRLSRKIWSTSLWKTYYVSTLCLYVYIFQSFSARHRWTINWQYSCVF